MRRFAYARPRTTTELFEILAAYGSGARVLAGGTDLMVGVRSGTVQPEVVVELKGLPELGPGIELVGGRLRVGATTVIADVIEDPRVRRYFGALVEAARMVGSVQIRNRATLAGNICNASPAADTAPPLLVYAAEAVLLSRAGSRRVSLADFFLGPRQTALCQGEVVAAIELPVPQPPFAAAFERLTRRRGVDLATISVCCGIDKDLVVSCAFGAAAPRPVLVAERTGVLVRPDVAEEARTLALEQLVAATSPIADVRAGEAYRHAMLTVFTRRALQKAMRRLSRKEQW